MNDTEIEIVVLKAQAGDPAAFDALYCHFCQPMRSFARTRVHDVMIAEDLVQIVWLKVARRLGRLNDVTLFRSWLYKALRWEIIDWQRKANKEVALSHSPEEEGQPVGRDASLEALPLLRTLNSSERDVAELYYINDLSVREISLITGVPAGTVKSRLHRAREQLKHQIVNAQKEKKSESRH